VKETARNFKGGKAVCPLDDKCVADSLVYKATVKGNKEKNYLALASTTFK